MESPISSGPAGKLSTNASTPMVTEEAADREPQAQKDSKIAILIVGVIALIATLIYLIGWSVFIAAVLWLVVVLALLAASFFGYAAFTAENTTDRKGNWIVSAVAIAITAIAWLLIPSGAAEGLETLSKEEATWQYWQELAVLSQKSKQLKTAQPPSEAAEIIAALRSLSSSSSDIARSIAKLPVSKVDQDVIDYASKVVHAFNETALMYSQFALLHEDSEAYLRHANSWKAGVESLVRSLYGDPLGKGSELNTAAQQLEQRRQELMARWAQLEQKFSGLNSEELQLRAILAKRYGREYPALD